MSEAPVDGAPETQDWRSYGPLELPRILECALDLFAEKGYHGTSVRDIARAVDVTVPAIYYHYRNKQDLLVTMIMSSIDDVLERAQQAVEEAGPAPDDRLSALVEAIVLYMAYRRDLGFLDSEIRSLEPDNRAEYVARRDRLQGLMDGILLEGYRAGTFATAYPVECSRAILSACQGVATWFRPDGPHPPETIAYRYADFALGMARQRG